MKEAKYRANFIETTISTGSTEIVSDDSKEGPLSEQEAVVKPSSSEKVKKEATDEMASALPEATVI